MVEVEVPLQFSSINDPVVNFTNIRFLVIEDPTQDQRDNIFIVLLADITVTLEKNEMNTAVMLVLLVPGMDVSSILVGRSRNIFSKSLLSPKLPGNNGIECDSQAISGIERDTNEIFSEISLDAKFTIADSSQSIVPALQDFKNPFQELIIRANDGLQINSPELCSEGVNGTYFLKDENGDNILVFKPLDEEGNGSPKKENHIRKSNVLPSAGIKEGEAAIREVAAFLLDREGFYGVPRTHMATINHHFKDSKTGSLQEFIESNGSTEDFGNRIFPVRQVHKIGILDIQILNIDRHAGNILVKQTPNNIELVPIDHGFSLPHNLEVPWFEWMNWPQAKIPFDDETKSYINRIDIEEDALLLQKLGIRSECIKTMKITTKLLKKAVTYEKTLYDIGSIICRDITRPDEPSTLEILCEKAQRMENEFFQNLEILLDEFMSAKD